jgi:hypothetical protein
MMVDCIFYLKGYPSCSELRECLIDKDDYCPFLEKFQQKDKKIAELEKVVKLMVPKEGYHFERHSYPISFNNGNEYLFVRMDDEKNALYLVKNLEEDT